MSERDVGGNTLVDTILCESPAENVEDMLQLMRKGLGIFLLHGALLFFHAAKYFHTIGLGVSAIVKRELPELYAADHEKRTVRVERFRARHTVEEWDTICTGFTRRLRLMTCWAGLGCR